MPVTFLRGSGPGTNLRAQPERGWPSDDASVYSGVTDRCPPVTDVT